MNDEYRSFPPPAGDPYGSADQPREGVPDEPEHTQALPVMPPPLGTESQATPPASHPRGRKRFAAGVIAASLVLGGAAGLGGAAAWTALDDDGSADVDLGGSDSATSQVAASEDTPAPDGSVEKVAQSVLPSVVKLDVRSGEASSEAPQSPLEGGPGAPEGAAGSGSGIILSSDGQILTNAHVAEVAGESGSITVSFSDGTKAEAELLGLDSLTDTALLQAQDVEGLTPATIGQSENVDVGEQVVAIGSPFGLDATVTSGIVSALDRPVAVAADEEGSTTYPAIQTDAAINPGNSGGPLVDMAGRVVGLNSSIRSASSGVSGGAGSIGLGFSIPITEILPIIEQIANGETPTHARLGITVRDVANSTGATVIEGAEIQDITDGSAAGSAGLESGDVITGIDDKQISGADSLVATIRTYRPGDDVSVTYQRGDDEGTTDLTLESDAEESTS